MRNICDMFCIKKKESKIIVSLLDGNFWMGSDTVKNERVLGYFWNIAYTYVDACTRWKRSLLRCIRRKCCIHERRWIYARRAIEVFIWGNCIETALDKITARFRRVSRPHAPIKANYVNHASKRIRTTFLACFCDNRFSSFLSLQRLPNSKRSFEIRSFFHGSF